VFLKSASVGKHIDNSSAAWPVLIRKVAITNAYECEALCVCVIHPTSDTPSTAPRQYILTMPSQNTYYCDCQ
jgi:hypothetical protein